MPTAGIFLIVVALIIVISLLLFFVSRYKRCPSDKVLVVYGKVGSDEDGRPRSAKCIHGGAAFIKPVIQNYTYMDLAPMSFDVDLKDALSKQNIRVDVPCAVTVAIDTDPVVLNNAAERLLNKNTNEIKALASTLFFGQLRLVI
ncbi:MAG: flotillin family protein, partial [Defluviitaleaceae bacterium]|nr:flotillin family protein [Defluviitaleaceae bacterium]